MNPRRGKKSYRQIWSEEDGISYDQSQDDRDQLPLNQGRGSIDTLTDDKVETNEVSIGPLISRLCSLLRYEHRTLPEDSSASTNGDVPATTGLGGDAMDLDQPNGEAESKPENKPLPSTNLQHPIMSIPPSPTVPPLPSQSTDNASPLVPSDL